MPEWLTSFGGIYVLPLLLVIMLLFAACANQRYRLTQVNVDGEWLTYVGGLDYKANRRAKEG